MLIAGVKLMVIGMLAVMIFLVVMVILILLTAKLTKKITLKEQQQIENDKKALKLKQKKDREKQARLKMPQQNLAPAREEVSMSIISAAVTAYEEENNAK